MAELTVLSGLPGAGKSTWAREHIARTGAVLVGRDEIRGALVSLHDEALITLLMASLVRDLLGAGCSVVVDAWNLHPDDRLLWQQLASDHGARMAWVHMPTSVDECARRDAARPDPVGEERVRAAADECAGMLQLLSATSRPRVAGPSRLPGNTGGKGARVG